MILCKISKTELTFINVTKFVQIFIDNSLSSLLETFRWNLNNRLEDDKGQSSVATDETEEMSSHHIMISYNSASRPLCLKIKAELEQIGHKVWIDVNDIHGSSLDSMARAVENARVVLICVTEKYRQSLNCQAEAQYAFKMNKRIVPLIMEKGYEDVKGWLGIIMSDKIFINFTKYAYEECIRRLKNEIQSEEKRSQAVQILDTKYTAQSVATNAHVNNMHSNERKNVEKWSEEDVRNWMSTNGIDESVMETILPCDGLILKQFLNSTHLI